MISTEFNIKLCGPTAKFSGVAKIEGNGRRTQQVATMDGRIVYLNRLAECLKTINERPDSVEADAFSNLCNKTRLRAKVGTAIGDYVDCVYTVHWIEFVETKPEHDNLNLQLVHDYINFMTSSDALIVCRPTLFPFNITTQTLHWEQHWQKLGFVPLGKSYYYVMLSHQLRPIVNDPQGIPCSICHRTIAPGEKRKYLLHNSQRISWCIQCHRYRPKETEKLHNKYRVKRVPTLEYYGFGE